MIFDAGADPFLGKWEGVGPWKSQVFWALYGTRLSACYHFTGHNLLPLALVMYLQASKILRTGRLNHRCINSYKYL